MASRALCEQIMKHVSPAACFVPFLKLTSIHHQRNELHCPWQNGRIERLLGTLKQKLDHWEVASFRALNVSLAEFRFFYNRVRPHQNLAACRT